MIAGLLPASFAACGGGGGDQFASEPAGKYPVDVVAARFPARQRLDQNAYLRLGVRNQGRKKIPALTMTITVGGRQGIASALPFSIRDPQPGLAIPDRPVWILDESYPRVAGLAGPGGAQTSNQKTFEFGQLNPGDARVAVWKLAAVRAGSYRLLYRVDAGLSGSADAVDADGGGQPVGAFAVLITSVPERTRINERGEIVPVEPVAKKKVLEARQKEATTGPSASGSGSDPPSGSLPPSGSG